MGCIIQLVPFRLMPASGQPLPSILPGSDFVFFRFTHVVFASLCFVFYNTYTIICHKNQNYATVSFQHFANESNSSVRSLHPAAKTVRICFRSAKIPSRSDFPWIFVGNRSACLNCYKRKNAHSSAVPQQNKCASLR